ncbi:MAG: CapA family protein [Steroidobacteraceae bacterium]|jgi:poly-gamma-glutamate capsule biosynthesis protein CapA/YwtB (metallophosphatase superfamily)
MPSTMPLGRGPTAALAALAVHMAVTQPAAAQPTSAPAAVAQPTEIYGPSDPIQKDPARFDPKRPIRQEMQTDVPDGFTVAAVGDLIISRPLSQYAARLKGFDAALHLLQSTDVVYGNLETTLFDARYFTGAPYSWDDDWTNSSEPGVAKDLKLMGFGLVSRANNHSLDWGLEGMRETSRHLDEAGIVYAGVGEDRGRARAPQFLETPKARIALVSVASTFRPTTDALPHHGAAPGRPGLSALHVARTIVLPPAAMRSLAEIDCGVHRRHCGETPAEMELFDIKYRLGEAFSYDYAIDPQDLAEIEKNIRSARENADLVIVSIHSHECSVGCDDPNQPRGAGNFLQRFAHEAIDSGADLFVTTGNHNLGAIELYKSPLRGTRPIFYGLGNFFWSDVQAPLPHDLFQDNRDLLEHAWTDPGKATDYDLTAPLNAASFAHDFTFRSVIAVSRFEGNQLAELRLYPVEDGYGERLPKSGIPRLVSDAAISAAIFRQIEDATRQFGLPRLEWQIAPNVATLRAGVKAR